MTNVLQLLDSFNQGGTESQTVQLVRLLHESGRHRVFVASLSSEGPLRREVERLGFENMPSFPLQNFYNVNAARQLMRLRSFIIQSNIHVVHAHDYYTNIFGLAAAQLARVPARIASRRETEGIRSPMKRWLERRAFNVADVVLANAEVIRLQLVKEGVPANKTITIHNGVDLTRLAPPEMARGDILNALRLPPHRRFVTIVANMRHVMKDQATLLRAAKLVRSELPETAFVLAGEGEQMSALRTLASDLGLDDSAFFIGRCAEVPKLLAVSDVCVLSSKGVEGFSNSILEYMAAARPVVATDVGGAREAVVEGETGFIVQPEDYQTMAERIIYLLRQKETARAMGQRGQQVVRERFSCEAQLRKVMELYDRILTMNPAHTLKSVNNPV
jgi:glycosyltransferase involved in cell wall biosynthesis